MSNTDTAVLKSGLGVFETIPTVWTTDALGTTPLLVTLAPWASTSGGRSRLIQVQIVNGSAANGVSWMVVPRGTPAPVFVSSFAAAPPSGVPVGAGATSNFVLTSQFDLYVVGSAAASSVAVISTLNG